MEEKPKTLSKNWKIIIGVAVILIFGARIYFSYEEKKERERQQQMLYELSRIQSEQFRENYSKNLDSMTKSMAGDLDKIQKGLDSIGKKLEADQKAFQENIKQ